MICTFLLGFNAFSLILQFDTMVCLHLFYRLFLVFLQVLQLHIIMFLFGLKHVEKTVCLLTRVRFFPWLFVRSVTHIHFLVKTPVHLISLGLQFGA